MAGWCGHALFVFLEVKSKTPTTSSWRPETDEGRFYAYSRQFCFATRKKILSVCKRLSKRCAMQTERGFLIRKISQKSELK
jgi:hypothetical protein